MVNTSISAIRKFFYVSASLVTIAVIAFVVGEIIVRIYSDYHMIYDLEMTRYSRWLKQESNNPKIGHVHRPGEQAFLMGVDVRINNDGFRDKDYSIERNDKARMIVLGDSLTFGWGVEKNETFTAIMEREMDPPTEIINLGVGNFNTRQQVEFFLERGLKYQPDQVLLYYFLNDAEPVPQPSRWSFLQYSDSLSLYWSAIRRLVARFTGTNHYLEYYKNLYKNEQPGWIDAKAAILELKEICDRQEIKLKIILLPEMHRLRGYPFSKEHAKVSGFLSQYGIRYTDLAPKFRHIQDPHKLWVAPDDAHPNAKAHRLIADFSLAYLKQTSKP